jgi:hypothetical protein
MFHGCDMVKTFPPIPNGRPATRGKLRLPQRPNGSASRCARGQVREEACLLASAIIDASGAAQFLRVGLLGAALVDSRKGSLSRKEIEDEGSRVLRERSPRGVQV